MRKTAPRRRTFKVDARALISLGRESIKDKTTALMELIKNSYDADATIVQLDFVRTSQATQKSYLRIADNGIGMTSAEIDSRWLRVGFSHKRERHTSAKGRRETGEKGVGRLSADRLGALLELRSKKSRSAAVGIRVNWDDFDIEGADIGQISILNLRDPEFLQKIGKTARSPGTEIIIRSLRQPWSDADLDELEVELSSLVNAGKVKDFRIFIRRSERGEYKEVESSVQGNAELRFTGRFSKAGTLTYRISARPEVAGGKRKIVKKGQIPWLKMNQIKGAASIYTLGPVEVELSFFLRSGVDLDEGLRLSQLRDYLDTQGGVRVYRDLIRVKPYGDSDHAEGDWLGLAARKSSNPAGARRESFRINNNQLVGSVLIGRDLNPLLSDSAAREGLIHGAPYEQLKAAALWCLILLESSYHERFIARQDSDSPKRLDAPKAAQEMRDALSEVVSGMEKANQAGSVRDENRILRQSLEQVADISHKVVLVERSIEEMANQTIVYRGLATVGISSAVFGHETEGAITQAKLSISLLQDLVTDDPLPISEVETELDKARRAVTRVQLWGNFALKRVKKDKRKRVRVSARDIVETMIREVSPIFDSSNISLVPDYGEDAKIRAFPMDLEAVLLNLLTNAYHAAGLSQQKLVKVYVGKDAVKNVVEINVMDSGPGIVREVESQIWSPLFSTKPGTKGKSVGTGLGLSIVKSICEEMRGTVKATANGELGGATFSVSLPI